MRASCGLIPLTRISPAVGASRSATALSSVVLPHPEGPMKETNSPRPTSRLTSLSARTGPSRVSKRSDTPLTPIATSGAAVLSAASRTGDSGGATAISASLARHAECGGELLVALERPGVRRERFPPDELAAAELGLHRPVAEHDVAARERI